MDKEYLIVYNPISGNGIANKIISNLSKDLGISKKLLEFKKTEYAGHAKEICQTIDKYKYLIAVGGDGTFNEIINGLMLNKNELPVLGFLPGGTGNSVMHDLGGENYKNAIQNILNGKLNKIDILKLQFSDYIEYSLNIVGWGMVADINKLSEKLRFLGSSRYTLSSLYYVFKKKSRWGKIIIDGVEMKENFLFILTSNTIHTGKGMKIAPNAKMNDGLLDIVILKSDISMFNLLILLPQIFTGKHILSKKIQYVQAKEISIDPKEEETLNIDGEIKCKTPVKVSIIPQRLEIFSSN